MKSIILAGGSGTRLWPLSREDYPKQFLQIFQGESLFQKAVRRARIFSRSEEIYVVTRDIYRFIVRNQIEEIGEDIPDENILLEPVGKNTLPAILYGVMRVKEDDVIAAMPADHMVEVNDEYLKAFKMGEKLAREHIVVFGIKPTRPHTGYGYIRPGKEIIENGEILGYRVEEFKEKPDMETAIGYVKSGYLWNSGIFLFSKNIFLGEVEKYQPNMKRAFEDDDISRAYSSIEGISMDYGIMEKTQRAAVVVFYGIWDDVGSFNSLAKYLEKDDGGNIFQGEFLSFKSRENVVHSEKLVVALGIENMMIVDTPDALLVAQRDMEQNVRDVFRKLKDMNDPRVKHSTTVYRPWGRYTVLRESENYKIKEIVVNPGKRISLQRHRYRSEHWVIISGTARITIGNKVFDLTPGMSTYVPVGEIHRLENPGREPLKIIEIQMGSYVGEDDIERLEDDYGRA